MFLGEEKCEKKDVIDIGRVKRNNRSANNG